MGLAALNIGPGDEVILADTNWIATAAPITYLGAKPVFVDILPDTWCLDPDLVEKAVNQHTKAIIAVHLYGNLCEMDKLLEIGQRHGIPIIEDAAEAIGSYWHGKHTGSMGLFGTFSFHGTKTLTTGEGGMFVTNDPNLYEKVLSLSNHGRVRGQKKQFWPELIGFKYKMSNVQAAIGCAQLERIMELIKRKREIFVNYRDRLCRLNGVTMNPEHPNTINGFWMPNVYFGENSKIILDDLMHSFAKESIDGRVFFHPLSSLGLFRGTTGNKNSYNIHRKSINLPSFHDITLEEQQRVIQTLQNLIMGH